MVTSADLLAAALRYAELGYRVFPCVQNAKTPLTAHGFHDAVTDAEQIARWWSHHPQANVGIAAKGLLVVDVDGRDNPWPGDPDRATDLAGAGAIATTPRGGRHFVFRRPSGKTWKCSQGAIATGVDVRTDGGYIVSAPSKTDDGAYAWAPGLELHDAPGALPEPPMWLAELLDLATEQRTVVLPASANGDTNTIPTGQRNATLARLAGSMRRVGMTRAEIAAALVRANEDRCEPPLSGVEVARIAASIARYEPDAVTVALVENHYEQMFAEPSAVRRPANPGPFPASLLDVPGFIHEVTAFTAATSFKPQPILALAGALALLGTLTGRKVRDELNSRTNVYCIGIGSSGGGKERPRLVNKEILFQAGAIRLLGPEGLASHAGLIAAVERQPAILFQLDEIGRILRTLADPSRAPHLYHIATNLMKLFTSSGSIYLGDAYADPDKNKVIHQPHACVYGTTVPQSLYEGLTAENVTDGFLSRISIFETPPEIVPKRRPPSVPIPTDILATARWWAEYNPAGNLQHEHPEPAVVPTTPAAHTLFDGLDRESEDAQRDLGEPLGALWTRATEKARKFGLLYACSRDAANPVVDEPAALWACELSRYLTRRFAFLVSQWVAETPFEARRKRVLRLIDEAGECGLSRSDLYKQTRSLTNRERQEVLESLQACGDVREVQQRSGKRGGAPSVRYLTAETAEVDVVSSS